MIEFGSDFHYMNISSQQNDNYPLCWEESNLYANGRHAIQSLIFYKKWQRIWIPEYFCYTVVEAIASTGIQISFYPDSPFEDDNSLISKIKFEKNDVLLRMNYFGLRNWRDESTLNIDVIEDHSHDLLGKWVQNSNADYCIASLRKTLPLPEGGVLWSPKKNPLPVPIPSSLENNLISYQKCTAMLLKQAWIEQNTGNKDFFRKIFIESENNLDNLALSGISYICHDILKHLDINKLYEDKKANWNLAVEILDNKVTLLKPESNNIGTIFSLVLLCESETARDLLRSKLIEAQIFPAILWKIPNGQSKNIIDVGKRILSLHCDARYTQDQIKQMCNQITTILYNNYDYFKQ